MTREEAKSFLTDISYKLGNMAVEYLTEKDGEKMREAIKALEQEPCDDCISRQAVLDYICRILNQGTGKKKSFEFIQKYVEKLPPVTPEKTTITYKDCSEAMLKMWIDNVLTDGQYNKIMDKLNAKHLADMRGVKNE